MFGVSGDECDLNVLEFPWEVGNRKMPLVGWDFGMLYSSNPGCPCGNGVFWGMLKVFGFPGNAESGFFGKVEGVSFFWNCC